MAVELGSLAVVEILIKHGANVNLVERNGISPLYVAARKPGNMGLDILRLLVKAGANIDSRYITGNYCKTSLVAYVTYSGPCLSGRFYQDTLPNMANKYCHCYYECLY